MKRISDSKIRKKNKNFRSQLLGKNQLKLKSEAYKSTDPYRIDISSIFTVRISSN